MKTWQENLLSELISHLEPNEDVSGLLLFGSFREPELHADEWSDLDILLVVKDGKLDKFFPTVAWITAFGTLYTYSQSADDFKCTTRVCFENFHRLDFVITTKNKLAEIHRWANVPFPSGVKVMFSRSETIDKIANQNDLPNKTSLATEEQFLALVREFRFKSLLAVYKVVRSDLLIALHLTLDLVRDCSVLEMMLRDRATGTNIHKHGGIGNQFVSQLEATQKPFTPAGILDSIQASNEVFERLAREWSGDYQENRHLLADWIERAKTQLQA